MLCIIIIIISTNEIKKLTKSLVPRSTGNSLRELEKTMF